MDTAWVASKEGYLVTNILVPNILAVGVPQIDLEMILAITKALQYSKWVVVNFGVP